MKWLGHRNLKALRDFLNDTYRMRDLAAFAANVAVTLPRVISSELAWNASGRTSAFSTTLG